jgi:hypothetical protein
MHHSDLIFLTKHRLTNIIFRLNLSKSIGNLIINHKSNIDTYHPIMTKLSF